MLICLLAVMAMLFSPGNAGGQTSFTDTITVSGSSAYINGTLSDTDPVSLYSPWTLKGYAHYYQITVPISTGTALATQFSMTDDSNYWPQYVLLDANLNILQAPMTALLTIPGGHGTISGSYTLKSGSTYYLEASSYNFGVGPFNLTITNNISTVVQCSGTTSGAAPGASTIAGTLSTSDSPSHSRSGHYADYYQVSGVGAATITMTGFDSYIYLYEVAAAPGSINPSTPQSANTGDSMIFTATPEIGYVVNKWQVNGKGVQTGGTTFTASNITGNTVVQVTFKTFPTEKVTPVSGSNGSISPGAVQFINKGGSSTFLARPDLGYLVDQWLVNGNVLQTGGTSFTATNVIKDSTVKVTFVYGGVPVYTLTPSAGINGSISPAFPVKMLSGDSMKFKATPHYGYVVDQWLVNGIPVQVGGASYTDINVLASAAVQVTFKPGVTPVVPTYTVTPSGDANAFISPSTAQTVSTGDSVDFTATTSTGYLIGQWLVSGSVVQTGGSTFTLNNVLADTNVQVTSTFGGVTVYTVTPSVYTGGSNGTISPSDPQAVLSGSSIVFTATPDSGYVVDTWLVNLSAVQTGGNTFTLNNVTADTAVQVTFKPGTYTVTPVIGGVGGLKLIKSNDDGKGVPGGGSLISYNLKATSTYYLEATSYAANSLGNYTLNSTPHGTFLEVLDPWQYDVVGGSYMAYAPTYSGTLSTATPSHARNGCNAAYYSINGVTTSGSAATTMKTTMTVTGFDSYLYVYDQNKKLIASNDDSNPPGGGGSRVTVSMLTGKTYTIEVTSYNRGVTGSFTLETTATCLLPASYTVTPLVVSPF